jgi:hypothetical protein
MTLQHGISNTKEETLGEKDVVKTLSEARADERGEDEDGAGNHDSASPKPVVGRANDETTGEQQEELSRKDVSRLA